MITEQTISQYLKGQCTEAEAAAVSEFLETNPGELSKYLGEEEWEAFSSSQTLDKKFSENSWQRIRLATVPPPSRSFFLIKRVSIAAAIILMAGLALIALLTTTETHDPGKAKATSFLKTAINTSSAPEILWLSDSSQVTLMPSSKLVFPETFDHMKREVSLKGEAIFLVRKEKGRPFSVSVDSLITEVLGTRFTIQAYATEPDIKVLLHEGKVRMSTTGAPFAGIKQTFDLLPGDAFIFNRHKRTVSITQTSTATSKTEIRQSGSKKKSSRRRSGDNWYMFNNQPLTDVFNQLQRVYNTTITYRPSDLRGMTFIGKIDKTDSLESILTAITMLNGLQLIKDEGGYIIKK